MPMSAIPTAARYHPVTNPDGIRCTSFEQIATQLGRNPANGFAWRPLDNIGTQDAAGIRLAERLRCDFAVLGTVQATPSHPDATPLGWARFAAMRERSTIPLYAIGGLGPDDIGTARAHGAQGIAAIRALWT